MVIATAERHFTPEEYLEMEEKALQKHEYRNGEIIPMAGATTNHNRIIINLCTYLNLTLLDQEAELFSSDVRLWIPSMQLYTYPDVMVVQEQPIYHPPGTTTITNPSLIIEVLSQSTQSYDRGDKFYAYRSIPEFKEYVLIDQYSIPVEHYVKTADHQWLLTEYTQENSLVKFESVTFEIKLQDLYKRVNFGEM